MEDNKKVKQEVAVRPYGYYSKLTKKVYDSYDDFSRAEEEYEKAHQKEIALKEEKKSRADEIDKAYEDMRKAIDHYNELVNKFVKDYGSYHKTYSNFIRTPSDLFDWFFDRF